MRSVTYHVIGKTTVSLKKLSQELKCENNKFPWKVHTQEWPLTVSK